MRGTRGKTLAATTPTEVAEHCIEGVRADRYYILPGSEDGDRRIRERADRILAPRDPVAANVF